MEWVHADSIENWIEEFHDVAMVSQVWLHLKTGLDWRMWFSGPPIRKMEDRLQWFTRMFDMWGLSFDMKYCSGGSNYKKWYKVLQAQSMALREQILSEEDYRELYLRESAYLGKPLFDWCVEKGKWELLERILLGMNSVSNEQGEELNFELVELWEVLDRYQVMRAG